MTPQTALPYLYMAPIFIAAALVQEPEPPPAVTETMFAHYIDVDQGDATLLEFPCGAILIDAGGQTSASTTHLVDFLTDFFANRRPDLNWRLDAIFITHNHVDHTLSLREVTEISDGADTIDVVRIIENGQRGGLREAVRDLIWAADTAAVNGLFNVVDVDDADIDSRVGFFNDDIDPIDVCSGSNIDPRITLLSADKEGPVEGLSRTEFGNKNNHSLVIRVDFGEASFLFTGDLEKDAIELLMERYEHSSMLNVDVYQFGHHGSANGTTVDFVAEMSPLISIGSMGRCDFLGNNPIFNAFAFGHPRAQVLDMLEAGTNRRRRRVDVPVAFRARSFSVRPLRRAIYTTAWDGDLRVTARSDGSYRVNREIMEPSRTCHQ